MAGKSKDTGSTLKIEVLPLWSTLLLEALSGPDDELGGLLLGILIQTRAQELGIPVNEITEDDCKELIEYFKTCETSTAKHAAFEKAVHLAAAGDFETAGQFIREYLNDGSNSIVNEVRAGRYAHKVEQEREFRERGVQAKQQQGREKKQIVLDKARELLKKWLNPKRPTGHHLARRVAEITGIPKSTVRRYLPEATMTELWAEAQQHKMDQTSESDPL